MKGSARVAYLASPDDEVRFVVDADATFADPHSPFPTEVSGRVRVSHYVAAGQPEPFTVWAEVAVDCMMTGGPTATVTGIVVDASPETRDWLGLRLGFSIYDGGSSDRIGFSGPTQRGEPLLQKCMAPAATFTVWQGGYTVRDELP